MRKFRKALLVVMCTGLLLATVAPMPALAAKPAPPEPFFAQGVVTSITTGQVIDLPNSDLFRIAKREMTGTLLMGNVTGDFVITYRGVADLTQAGDLSGNLDAGDYKMLLEGQSYPLQMVPVEIAPGVYIELPMVSLSGSWKSTKGAHGEGVFYAYGVFIPTPDGHVGTIVDSNFVLQGTWQPK